MHEPRRDAEADGQRAVERADEQVAVEEQEARDDADEVIPAIGQIADGTPPSQLAKSSRLP